MHTMTPKERMTAFLTRQRFDRVPCVPLILNHAARVLGVPVGEYARSGEVMARAHVAAWRRYGQDLITIFSDTAILAEAMGTRLYFPPDDVPRVAQPAVAEPEDAARLEPIDVRRAGRLPLYLEAIRRCVEEVGEEVMVSCCFASPFTTAACLRGTATFARDLVKRPDLVRALLDRALRVVEDFAAAVAEAGGIPVLVDPVASGSFLSRKAFQDFAAPGNARALATIRSLGFPPVLHICGRTSAILDLMADTGAAVLSVDVIELAEARDRVGDRVCLMGNVCPTGPLLDGTPDAVRAEARRCLQTGRGGRAGFILATGCEVPVDAPPENVEALMAVAREAAA